MLNPSPVYVCPSRILQDIAFIEDFGDLVCYDAACGVHKSSDPSA
jgi:hypothetical protein